jgi:putative transcriptional regulator
LTRQTVVAVEAGDDAPSVYLALSLAGRLGRSVEELFGEAEAGRSRVADATEANA